MHCDHSPARGLTSDKQRSTTWLKLSHRWLDPHDVSMRLCLKRAGKSMPQRKLKNPLGIKADTRDLKKNSERIKIDAVVYSSHQKPKIQTGQDHICSHRWCHRQCQGHRGPHVHPEAVPRPPKTTRVPTDGAKATTVNWVLQQLFSFRLALHYPLHSSLKTHPHLYQDLSRIASCNELNQADLTRATVG